MNRSRVRFPQAAPFERHSGYKDFRVCREVFGGGVFAVLGRFVGCWGRAYWTVERLPAGADRSFGVDSQKVSCTVAAGSVKRFSPASKSMGLSSKSTEPELTDISKVATGLRCPGEPGGSYLYCWNSSVRLARFRVERLLWVKSKWV